MFTYYLVIEEDGEYYLFEFNAFDNSVEFKYTYSQDELFFALDVAENVADFIGEDSLLMVRTIYGTLQKSEFDNSLSVRIRSLYDIKLFILVAHFLNLEWSSFGDFIELLDC